MSDPEASGIVRLVRETRERRTALHALVERLGGDRRLWEHEMQSLPERQRLTASQRHQFRAFLSKHRDRRRP